MFQNSRLEICYNGYSTGFKVLLSNDFSKVQSRSIRVPVRVLKDTTLRWRKSFGRRRLIMPLQ